MRRSGIGWCDYSGADLNFVIGCQKISEGCANCYGFRWAKRAGRDFAQVITYWDKLNRLWKARWSPGDQPYRRGPGSNPIMFPVDLGDLFHPDVPEEMIMVALDIFAARDDADWIVLTKRPERMLDVTNYWLDYQELEILPSNIWCLVTAENQYWANERVRWLLRIRAAMRGVSIEPMLEPMAVDRWFNLQSDDKTGQWIERMGPGLDWVIVGAESGPGRRPFDPAWALDVYRQCQRAGVPFFGKQASGLRPGVPLLLGGREVKEWPQ